MKGGLSVGVHKRLNRKTVDFCFKQEEGIGGELYDESIWGELTN